MRSEGSRNFSIKSDTITKIPSKKGVYPYDDVVLKRLGDAGEKPANDSKNDHSL